MKALFNLVHVDVDSISTYRDAGLSAQTPPRNDVFIDQSPDDPDAHLQPQHGDTSRRRKATSSVPRGTPHGLIVADVFFAVSEAKELRCARVLVNTIGTIHAAH